MPSFKIGDSSGNEGVLNEGSSHIQRVQAPSKGGQLSRSHGSTGVVGKPAPIAVKVGDELLRARA
jgi:hypothetical protein